MACSAILPFIAGASIVGALLLGVAGCQTGTIPDPNATGPGISMEPEVMRRNLADAYVMLSEREAQGQITAVQRELLLAKIAREMIAEVDVQKENPLHAWQYGEVYRTAKDWPKAQLAYEIAMRHDQGEQRRIFDSMRLAESLAHQGKVKRAIDAARSVFDTPNKFADGVLLPVYLEIIPAARKYGSDVELAKLLEEAIHVHVRAIVDPSQASGQAFMAARAHHIDNAWRLVDELYTAADRPDLAHEARIRRARMMASLGPS